MSKNLRQGNSSNSSNRPSSAFFRSRTEAQGLNRSNQKVKLSQSNQQQQPRRMLAESPYQRLEPQQGKLRSSSNFKSGDLPNRPKYSKGKIGMKHSINLQQKANILRNSYNNSKNIQSINILDVGNQINATLSKHKQNNSFIPGYVNVSIKNSFNASVNNYDSPGRKNLNQTDNLSPKLIQEKLEKDLKKVQNTQNDRDKLVIYGEMMDQIIKNDGFYGKILSKIRDGYDEWLTQRSQDHQTDRVAQLKQEVKQYQEKIKQETQLKKQLQKKTEKFKKENLDLAKNLEEREVRYMDLQDRMFKISKVNIEGIELDQQTWNELVKENTKFSETISKMRQELKSLKYKEKRLIKLILTMKKLNYPVEEIYEEDVRKQRKKRRNKQITNLPDDDQEEEFEYEPIASGPPLQAKRPEIVPILPLENIERDESSGSSYSESESDPSDAYSQSKMSNLRTVSSRFMIRKKIDLEDDWDKRFWIARIPDYNAYDDPHCSTKSGFKIRKVGGKLPEKQWAPRSISTNTIIRQQTKQKQRKQENPDIEIDEIKKDLNDVWDRADVPDFHRQLFALKVYGLPHQSALKLIQQEMNDIQSSKSTILQILETISKRELLLHRLQTAEVVLEEPGRSIKQLEIGEMLENLRKTSLDIIEGIKEWREELQSNKAIFKWNDRNYLEKMSEDCQFLGDSQAAKIISIPKNTTTFITNQPSIRAKSGKKIVKNSSAKKMNLAISYALQRRIRAAENLMQMETGGQPKRAKTAGRTTKGRSQKQAPRNQGNIISTLDQDSEEQLDNSSNKSFSSIGSELDQLSQDQIKDIAFEIYEDLISNYISEEKVQNFAMQSSEELIDAALNLFKSSILDDLIVSVLKVEVEKVAQQAKREVKDSHYIDFQVEIIQKAYRMELEIVAERYVQQVLAGSITEDFLQQIEVGDIIDESLQEENEWNARILDMVFIDVMASLVEEEWVELLAEDTLSNSRLDQMWEILPPQIQQEIYKTERDKIHNKLTEDIYFSYLNDTVAGIWVPGILNMAIAEEFYPNSRYSLEDAMPIASQEDIEIQEEFNKKSTTNPLFKNIR